MESRNVSGWRIAATLVAVVVGVALLGFGAWAVIDRFLPGEEPAEKLTSRTPTTAVPPSAKQSTESTAPGSVNTPSVTPTPTPPPASKPTPKSLRGLVVVIDPGHQGKQITKPEPIGPGATQTKPGVSTGTSGVVTHKPESVLALEISLKLRDELEQRGAKVIMTRTTQNVSLGNIQRAAIANKAHAALFIRIHADGSPDRNRRGISTLVPAPNKWTRPIVKESTIAGRFVQQGVLRTTGAVDLGVTPRADITGFNWSKVPTCLVETGFMSNPAEDRLLSTSAYQRKLAVGMANGVIAYLRTLR